MAQRFQRADDAVLVEAEAPVRAAKIGARPAVSLPLARLRGLVDDFHFNRLAMVGEGANLRLPSRERYERFLGEYLEAVEHEVLVLRSLEDDARASPVPGERLIDWKPELRRAG
mgnify:CR=1 FL=1